MTNWWHPKAWWAADFVNDQYGLRSADSTLTAIEACTRSSIDYDFDANGNLVQFPANAARQINGVGLFAGSSFTNKIRNPRGEGATAGVVDAGGVLPTNWAVGVAAGLSTEVKGVGTEGGLPYVELRIFGTASSTTDYTLLFDNSTNAAAVAGDAWGVDMRVKAIAGTQVPLRVAGVDYAGGTPQYVMGSVPVTPTGSIARLQKSFIAVYPTATNVRAMMRAAVSSAASYDFTLRIYCPKLCKISVTYGPELLTNPGNPFTNASGWTPETSTSVAVAGGALRVQKTSTGGGNRAATSFVVADGFFKFVSSGITPGGGAPAGRIDLGPAGNTSGVINNFTATTPATLWLVVSASTLTMNLGAGGNTSGMYADYSGVSVKQAIFGYFPDFPILPPAGTPGDATKFADDVKALASGSEPFAGFAAAGLGSGLSMLAAVNLSHVGDGVVRPLAEISDGTTSNRLRLYLDTDDKPAAQVVSGGVVAATVKLASALTTGRAFIAVNFDPAGGLYIVRQAGLENASAALASMPAGLSTMRLGSSLMSNYLNDKIEQMQVCAPLSQAAARTWVQGIATGALNVTLGNTALAGSGTGRSTGAAASQLEDVGMAGAGNAASVGLLAAALDGAACAGAGEAAISGQVAAILEDALCAAAAALVATGRLEARLDDIEVAATGRPGPTWPLVAETLHLTGVRPGPIRITGRIGERQ